MKRLIVVDKSGKIVATGPHPDDFTEAEGEGRFGVLPLDQEHAVHEVELPDHIKTMEDIQRLHDRFTVSVEEGEGEAGGAAGLDSKRLPVERRGAGVVNAPEGRGTAPAWRVERFRFAELYFVILSK